MVSLRNKIQYISDIVECKIPAMEFDVNNKIKNKIDKSTLDEIMKNFIS